MHYFFVPIVEVAQKKKKKKENGKSLVCFFAHSKSKDEKSQSQDFCRQQSEKEIN